MKKLSTLFSLIIGLCFAAQAQVYTTIDSVRLNNANGVPLDSGTIVAVTGIVYGPNSYPTPNGDVFMLRGQTQSIKIYSKDTYGYTVHDGDSVLVIGTSSTYHGNAEIDLTYTSNVDTIIPLSSGGTIDTPLVVSVIGESNESQLIQVNNVNMSTQTGWTLPHTKHSFNVHVGNLYLFVDSFMSPDLWNLSAAPSGVYNIVGFGTQYGSAYPYNSGYSLEPRSLNDFHPVTTGINEVNNLTAAIFPNPASTKLTVTFSYDKEEPYTVRITDMTGRVMFSENGTVINGDNTLEFNTSNYSNGMYILDLHTANKSLVTKVTIAK